MQKRNNRVENKNDKIQQELNKVKNKNKEIKVENQMHDRDYKIT